MTSVVITGYARQAPYLSRLLNRSPVGINARCYAGTRAVVARSALRMLLADASIAFGGPAPNALIVKICNASKKPAIVLWAGSDVLELSKVAGAAEMVNLQNIVHWSCSEHLCAELRAFGVTARYVPVASAAVPKTVKPLPENFTVLTYLPQPRREFYGQRYVWEAAEALRDATFLVVGGGPSESDAPPNVRYLGEVPDIEPFIDDATVILRIPEHDGLARTIVEGLARGRHAVWTYSFPGVVRVQSPADAVEALKRLYEMHSFGALDINYAGMRYVAIEHNPERIAKGVASALHDAIGVAKIPNAREERTRLAFSGSPLLCARIAANCQKYSTNLEAAVLNADSKSETLASALELIHSRTWCSIGEPRAPRVLEFAAVLTGKRRILHWLGDDVDLLSQQPVLLRRFRASRFTHLAQDDRVQKALLQLGIPASIVPIPALPLVQTVHPLPAIFTVLLYLPKEQPQFYGRYQYERLMQGFEGEPIHYIVVGGGEITIPSHVSAERAGWCPDLEAIYDRSTVLVRFTGRETLSMMVIEALLHGRYVVSSLQFPHTIAVNTYTTLESTIRRLFDEHAHGRLEPQTAVAAAMNDVYRPDRCLELLARTL